MKIYRWACGHTPRDHVKNDNIRERLKVDNITERYRKEETAGFNFGHLKRRNREYIGRKTREMLPHGRRRRKIQQQRWMDSVNQDLRAIGTTEDEVYDRTSWRRIVSVAATPQLRERAAIE